MTSYEDVKHTDVTLRIPKLSTGQLYDVKLEDDVIMTLRRRTCCTCVCVVENYQFLRHYISELVYSRERINTSFKRRHSKLFDDAMTLLFSCSFTGLLYSTKANFTGLMFKFASNKWFEKMRVFIFDSHFREL